MKKLLSLLVVVGAAALGGAYYYLSFIMPEREIVAFMDAMAKEAGSTFSYDDIETGPLGLDGAVLAPTFSIPGAEGQSLKFNAISYELDPLWLVLNIPNLIKTQSITHYKALSFDGFNHSEEGLGLLKVGSLRFEGLNYTGLALKIAEDPNYRPEVDLAEDFTKITDLVSLDGFVIRDVDVEADTEGVSIHLGEQAIRGLTLESLAEISVKDVRVNSPDGALSLRNVEIRNINYAMRDNGLPQNPFSVAELFLIEDLTLTDDENLSMGFEEIRYQEREVETIDGAGRVPIDTILALRGLFVPTAIFAEVSPDAQLFFTANSMDALIFDYEISSRMDLKSGLSSSTLAFTARDLVAVSTKFNLMGTTPEAFTSLITFMEEQVSPSPEIPEGFNWPDFIRWITAPILEQDLEKLKDLPDIPLPSLPDPMEMFAALGETAYGDQALSGITFSYEDLSLYNKMVVFMEAQGLPNADAVQVVNALYSEPSAMATGTPVLDEIAAGLAHMADGGRGFKVTTMVQPPFTVREGLSYITEDNVDIEGLMAIDWTARLSSELTVLTPNVETQEEPEALPAE